MLPFDCSLVNDAPLERMQRDGEELRNAVAAGGRHHVWAIQTALAGKNLDTRWGVPPWVNMRS